VIKKLKKNVKKFGEIKKVRIFAARFGKKWNKSSCLKILKDLSTSKVPKQ